MTARLLPEQSMSAADRIELQEKLLQFYASVHDYTAFENASDQRHCWCHLLPDIKARLNSHSKSQSSLRMLEIGSGRSGIGQWLHQNGMRERVHLTSHDVTPQNASWLERYSDDIVIGEICELSGKAPFDIIISTYVLEHVPAPSIHLDLMKSILRPAGSIFLFCPRYDFPGYMCPSSRHLALRFRINMILRVAYHRIRSLILRRPAFLVLTDLAAFHGPFFTDADAVHWVSLLDLRLWAAQSKLRFRKLAIGEPRMLTKDWIVKRWLTCAVEFRHN